MTRRVLALTALTVAALAMATSFANAFGITKTLKFSIADTSLGGYVTTPVTGYDQVIQWGLATSTLNSFAIIHYQPVNNSNSYPAALGNPPWITIVGPTGTVLSKEQLPAAMQPTLTDCTVNGCQPFTVYANPIQQLTGRLLVQVIIPINNGGSRYSYKSIAYILDTTAAIGSLDRWTLVLSSTTPPKFLSPAVIPPLINPTLPFPFALTSASFSTAYEYDMSTAGTTKVYTLINK